MSAAYDVRKNTIRPTASRAAGERGRASEQAQSRRMLVALALLMVAIAVVAFRDREFLFEAAPTQPQGTVQQSQSSRPELASPAAIETQQVASPGATPDISVQKVTDSAATPINQVANSQNRAKTSSLVPEAPPSTAAVNKPAHSIRKNPANASAAAVTSQAAQRGRLSEFTGQKPDIGLYPRLDERTKIEGSVELQALVGTDGTIQELHVVRGPAVLGSAAREAVLQWKFKPYTQNGVAVETYARVTVNFTIKVVDGSPKTVASVAPERVIVLADNYQR